VWINQSRKERRDSLPIMWKKKKEFKLINETGKESGEKNKKTTQSAKGKGGEGSATGRSRLMKCGRGE